MSKNNEAVAEVAVYFSGMITVGLGFVVGYLTGNPFVTIGVGLLTFPIAWLLFAYILAKIT